MNMESLRGTNLISFAGDRLKDLGSPNLNRPTSSLWGTFTNFLKNQNWFKIFHNSGSLIVLFLTGVSMVYLVKLQRKLIDKFSENQEEVNPRLRKILFYLSERMKRKNESSDVQLSPALFGTHELAILSNVILPTDINKTWEDVGGLADVKEKIFESIVMPLRKPEIFQESKLFRFPTGVLFHGKPGTGKTLLAKVIAKEADVVFINVNFATIFQKYFGETEKMVEAIFTLAQKLQPAIIFIDEIDSVLSHRQSFEHEANSRMKTLFMMLWDGISSKGQTQICVVAATNRPETLDSAIMRRFSVSLNIPTPNQDEREEIFAIHLKGEDLDSSVTLKQLAQLSDGYSGSDIYQLCTEAASYPLSELLKAESLSYKKAENNQTTTKEKTNEKQKLRKLQKSDFIAAKKIIDSKRLQSVSPFFQTTLN